VYSNTRFTHKYPYVYLILHGIKTYPRSIKRVTQYIIHASSPKVLGVREYIGKIKVPHFLEIRQRIYKYGVTLTPWASFWGWVRPKPTFSYMVLELGWGNNESCLPSPVDLSSHHSYSSNLVSLFDDPFLLFRRHFQPPSAVVTFPVSGGPLSSQYHSRQIFLLFRGIFRPQPLLSNYRSYQRPHSLDRWSTCFWQPLPHPAFHALFPWQAKQHSRITILGRVKVPDGAFASMLPPWRRPFLAHLPLQSGAILTSFDVVSLL